MLACAASLVSRKFSSVPESTKVSSVRDCWFQHNLASSCIVVWETRQELAQLTRAPTATGEPGLLVIGNRWQRNGWLDHGKCTPWPPFSGDVQLVRGRAQLICMFCYELRRDTNTGQGQNDVWWWLTKQFIAGQFWARSDYAKRDPAVASKEMGNGSAWLWTGSEGKGSWQGKLGS